MLQLPKLIPALSQGCCPGATCSIWGCLYFMFLCLMILKCSLDIVNDASWRFGISSQALNDYQYSTFFFCLSSDRVTWKFLFALAKWIGVCSAHAWYQDPTAFPHAWSWAQAYSAHGWYQDQAEGCSDLWYFLLCLSSLWDFLPHCLAAVMSLVHPLDCSIGSLQVSLWDGHQAAAWVSSSF